MNRILTFHLNGVVGSNTRMSPHYYIEDEYTPKAVRIYAEYAPDTDASFDIFDDGVSIFNDRGSTFVGVADGVISTKGSGTSVTLAAGQNSEDSAENFNDNVIEEGSWIYCTVVDSGSGRNFTVQLELEK